MLEEERMLNGLIRQSVNLLKLPKKQDHFTLGDLHANALNLIRFLIDKEVIKDIEQEDYNDLCDAYLRLNQLTSILPGSKIITRKGEVAGLAAKRKPEIEAALNAFITILDEAKWLTRPHLLIRLLGDMVSDRGANDYLMLFVLKRMVQHDIPVEIVLSNHDLDFLINLPALDDEKIDNKTMPGYPRSSKFGKSFLGLLYLLKLGIVEKRSVNELIDKVYLPNLKIMSYSIHKKEDDYNIVNVNTHGVPDLILISDIANLMLNKKVDVKSLLVEANLISTIDQINEVFDKIKADRTKLVAFVKKHREDKDSPIHKLVWRRYEALNPEQDEANKEDKKDSKKEDELEPEYYLFFRHGHDTNDDVNKALNKAPYIKYLCLDNDAGKHELGEATLPYVISDSEDEPEEDLEKKKVDLSI